MFLDKVDGTAKCIPQGIPEIEVMVEGRRCAFWIEFDKKVGVAGLWIEIRTA